MNHRHATDTHLNSLFDEAERNQTCLFSCSQSDSKALAIRHKEGLVVRPFRGLYARSSYWTGLGRRQQIQHIIRSLSSLHPNWVFSHQSAAVMYNLEVSYKLLWPLHYKTSNSTSNGKTARIIPHRSRACTGHSFSGANVTSVEQAVIDCAASMSLQEALPIADSSLHLNLTTKDRLNVCLEHIFNRRGISRARRIIKFADHRPDNGGESAVRAIMLEANLPSPELQASIQNISKTGHFYYADFLFTRPDGVRVDMELDGLDKYSNPAMTQGRSELEVMMAGRQREADITAQGIRVVRFAFRQACNKAYLLDKLAAYGIVPV